MIEVPHWWLERSFLYVGRMAMDKGVNTILRAWLDVYAKYPEECPPLWLVGGTPSEIDELRQTSALAGEIRRHELARRIQWWGYLDAAGISTLLLRTLVLIMHSRYEPGGRIVLEAMCEGVPVIATPHGFAQDLIVDWKNGFLVNFGDRKTLVRRMEHFIRQPLLRNSLGASAREEALNSLSTWSFLDKHCQIYDLAMGKDNGCLPVPNSQEDKVRYSYYSCRRFVPTYPYGEETPSKEKIIEFVESAIDKSVTEIYFDYSSTGSSFHWVIATGLDRWVVKWPFTRLATRPLWDPDRRKPLVRNIKKRFATELFSSNLSGFAQLIASDTSNHLLLRPLLQPLQKSIYPEGFRCAASALRKLYKHPLPEGLDIFKEIDKDWSKSSSENVKLALANIYHDLAKCSEPWNNYRHVSLRLAWRQLEMNLLSGKLWVPDGWLVETQQALNRFISIARMETDAPIVICHGSGDLDHCVLDGDGSVYLIDGENIHPGWPGEDSAAMIGCAIDDLSPKQNEFQIWSQALDAIAEDKVERAMIISWAAFLALEDICRNTTLIRPIKVEHYQRRWQVLERLALEVDV